MPDRHQDQDENALLDELQALFDRIYPVPPDLVALVEASLVLRTIDADLAALTYDSDLDRAGPVGVRGAPTHRLLTFEAPGVIVEVEAVAVGARRRIVGQLLPAGAGAVEVLHPGGVSVLATDELGRFVAFDLAPGPASVRGRVAGPAGGTAFQTDWFVA